MTAPTMSELYELAYAPGSWECPKCGFILYKSTISPQGIGTSEENRQSEPCPNDGEWMVPVTWKSVAKNNDEAIRRLLKRLEVSGVDDALYRGFMAQRLDGELS